MEKEKNIMESKEKQSCSDKHCPVHGKLKARGRTFRGRVIKKFDRRITIEFGRIIKIRKYESYAKRTTKIHARLPECEQNNVKIGDYVEVRECRPLSKIIHFVFIKQVKNKSGEKTE